MLTLGVCYCERFQGIAWRGFGVQDVTGLSRGSELHIYSEEIPPRGKKLASPDVYILALPADLIGISITEQVIQIVPYCTILLMMVPAGNINNRGASPKSSKNCTRVRI